MEREFNTAEVTAAVKIHLAACLMDDVAKDLSRVLTLRQRQGVLRRAEGLHTLYISIHSPHTGRDDELLFITPVISFQSTLPTRGETANAHNFSEGKTGASA